MDHSGQVEDGDSFMSNEYALAGALENFIVPLIHQDRNYVVRCSFPYLMNIIKELGNVQHARDVDLDGKREISPEARDLLFTLRRYVQSVVSRSSDSVAQDKRITSVLDEGSASHCDGPESILPQGGQKKLPVEADSKDDDAVSLIETLVYQIISPLDEERDIVFNKMPIRLLMFNGDGSGIRLVGRQELFRHIETCTDTTMYTSYAILSHTWLQQSYGEVTYADWIGYVVDKNSRGYLKLANFCKTVATHYGIRLAWMDTVCINKESSTELDESIRSMYKWYQSAAVCLVYLADTDSSDNMVNDRWFTRGWTLQELIAPKRTHFFNARWEKMVDKYSDNWKTDTIRTSISRKISEASNILEAELESCCLQLPGVVPIWRRMQWAAARNVTREEDTAYSLMGIFDVSISTAYGEGKERAFYRLVREILNTNTPRALEIINWGYGYDLSRQSTITPPRPPSALLPSSPKQYTWSAKDIEWPTPSVPLTLSHLGLCVRMLLMPAFEVPQRNYLQRQRSSDSTFVSPVGGYYATAGPITAHSTGPSDLIDQYFDILHWTTLPQLTRTATKSKNKHVSVFAVLNFEEKANTVTLPSGYCFALLDWRPSGVLESGKILDEYRFSMTAVKDVITFKMKSRSGVSLVIEKSSLARHGISLHTGYV